MAIEHAKDVTEITVTDPDSKGAVQLCVFKDSGGGMFAVDAAFLEEMDVVPNPLQNGSLIHLMAGEEEVETNPIDHDLYLINKLLVLFDEMSDKALLADGSSMRDLIRKEMKLSKSRFQEIIDRAESNAAEIDE